MLKTTALLMLMTSSLALAGIVGPTGRRELQSQDRFRIRGSARPDNVGRFQTNSSNPIPFDGKCCFAHLDLLFRPLGRLRW